MIFFHSRLHHCTWSDTDDVRHETLNHIVMTWHFSEACWTTSVNNFSFFPTRANKIYFLAIKSVYIYCLLLLQRIVRKNSQMNSSKNKSNNAMKSVAKQTITRRKWQTQMYRFDGQVQMTTASQSHEPGSTCPMNNFFFSFFFSKYHFIRQRTRWKAKFFSAKFVKSFLRLSWHRFSGNFARKENLADF